MEQKRIVIAVGCLIMVGIMTFLTWCTVLYFKRSDDYDKAWQAGYDTALTAKLEYETAIKKLEADKLALSTDLAQSKASVDSLTASNTTYAAQIETLTAQKTELETSVVSLTQIKAENELTITSLNTQVTGLTAQIDTLNTDVTNKTAEIADLNGQISTLNNRIAGLSADVSANQTTIDDLNQLKQGLENQVTNLTAQINAKTQEINTLNANVSSLNNMVKSLQSTNELQATTITNLNTQIISLNTQISNLTLQINNNSSNVTALNNKIAQLENSISYYEQYIAGLENGTQVVATLEFNGSVYNVQVVQKGGKISVVEPVSTDYVIFNYWTIDGQQIDLDIYVVNASVKIIANVTYKYDVNFYVDNASVDSQIVIKNGNAVAPTAPTKDGYEFDGWSLDGTNIVDITSTPITKNTIFYAVFTKLHTVTFNDGETVIDTQSVRNGQHATNVNIDNTTYKIFNGWTVGGSIVNLSEYTISADTVFTASYTYKYDVVFKVDDTVHNSQIITQGGHATIPQAPTKDGYQFDGWTLNGVDVVDLATVEITQNTTFIAKFTFAVNQQKFMQGINEIYTLDNYRANTNYLSRADSANFRDTFLSLITDYGDKNKDDYYLDFIGNVTILNVQVTMIGFFNRFDFNDKIYLETDNSAVINDLYNFTQLASVDEIVFNDFVSSLVNNSRLFVGGFSTPFGDDFYNFVNTDTDYFLDQKYIAMLNGHTSVHTQTGHYFAGQSSANKLFKSALGTELFTLVEDADNKKIYVYFANGTTTAANTALYNALVFDYTTAPLNIKDVYDIFNGGYSELLINVLHDTFPTGVTSNGFSAFNMIKFGIKLPSVPGPIIDERKNINPFYFCLF